MKTNSFQTQLNTAIYFHHQGQLKKADELYRELLQQRPENVELLYYFGKLNVHLRYYKSAIFWIKKALLKAPPQAMYYNTLGLAYQGLNQSADAKKCFEQALFVQSDFNLATHNLGQLNQAYREESDHLQLIKQILNTELTLIFTCNSSGSIFLQSLLDHHPQVLMFPSIFLMNFHHPLQNKLSIALQNSSFGQLDELIALFCQIYLMCFDSEQVKTFLNLGQLGKDKNRAIKVDISCFKGHMLRLFELFQSEGYFLSRKLFFLVMHYAYALAQGQQIEAKNLIIYPIHIPELFTEIQQTYLEFPYLKSIVTMRHPLKSFHSALRRRVWRLTIQNEKTYDFVDTVLDGSYYEFYRLQLMAYQPLMRRFLIPVFIVTLESLHNNPQKIMADTIRWLGLTWDDSLLKSTFNGLDYWGAKMMRSPMSGFSKVYHQRDVGWKEQLDQLDAYTMGAIFSKTIEHYQYAKVSPVQKFLASTLVFLPTHLERLALKKTIKNKQAKLVLKAIYKRSQMSLRYLKGEGIEKF